MLDHRLTYDENVLDNFGVEILCILPETAKRRSDGSEGQQVGRGHIPHGDPTDLRLQSYSDGGKTVTVTFGSLLKNDQL